MTRATSSSRGRGRRAGRVERGRVAGYGDDLDPGLGQPPGRAARSAGQAVEPAVEQRQGGGGRGCRGSVAEERIRKSRARVVAT